MYYHTNAAPLKFVSGFELTQLTIKISRSTIDTEPPSNYHSPCTSKYLEPATITKLQALYTCSPLLCISDMVFDFQQNILKVRYSVSEIRSEL